MPLPHRLVTSIDVDEGSSLTLDTRGYGIRTLHELELTDGRRAVLLDDRGWAGGPQRPR